MEKIPGWSIRKNYRAIFGTLLLAFLLWFMVKMNKHYEYNINIPVIFENLDQDKIFKYSYKDEVNVEFLGKGMDLLRLNFYHVYYRIDLSGAPRYLEFDLSEHPEYVTFPRELDISVKSILRPRTLVVELDRKMQRKLPVEVDYTLTEPPGMILVNVTTEPESVLVTGPAQMFNKIHTISTEKKEFKEPLKPFTQEFTIHKSDEYFGEYEPRDVKVTFDIQRLAEKEILEVPVTIIHKPANLEVIPLPSVANIYLKGGEKILADLDLKDFQIIIDFKKVWSPGVSRVKADLVTKADVLYMETRPPVFELIVQRKQSK
jgi:YbbR domain-containing protein